MAVLTPLKAITILAAEQSTVQAAVGYEDATGMMTSIVVDVAEIIAKLTRLAAFLPGGANLTAINTAITTLS